jgi:diaminopimelate epimerase
MRFTKMQGTGNDFVLVEPQGREEDWSKLAVAMCDRHFGVGADGLILVLPAEGADLRMRMFNPDGSEAEMCGNGIRCFAKYAVERGLAPASDGRLTVDTLAGVLTAEVSGDGGRVERVRTSMGAPRFAPAEIPVSVEMEPPIRNLSLEVEGRTVAVTCVSMGNPHAVHFYAQPVSRYPLEEVGPKVEHHSLFPQRVNFEVARVLNRESMEARVWERGAGATLACGSGASAAMVAAHIQGMVDEKVDIKLPGGTLTIEWDGEGEVYLSGPAAEVFVGEWPEPSSGGGGS